MSLARSLKRMSWGFLAILLSLGVIVTLGLNSFVEAEQGEGTTAISKDDQRRITVGGLHTCAVLDTGEIQCWGANANGQLGNGTVAATTVPKKVQGVTTALQVSAGSTHTCALVHPGSVKCWGNNGSGQLGNNQTSPPNPPVLAPVSVVNLNDAIEIAAGGFHTCALVTGGEVKCWGDDGNGQLGDGGGTGNSLFPVTVSGVSGATAIAAGEYHTCALLGTGEVKCWGHNGFGQLGNGVTTTATAPVTVSGIPFDDGHPPAHDPHKAVAIAAGESHTCAALDDGTALCWGHNFYGQLGNNASGEGSDSLTPVKVQIDIDPTAAIDLEDLDNVRSITAGQFHSCARLSGDTVSCWGNNGRGQLGDNTSTACGTATGPCQKIAVPVQSLANARAVTAGGFHTCALISGNTMKCWGYNFYGQLGTYAASNPEPVTVTALSGVVTATSVVTSTVSTGDGHACALVVSAEVPPTVQPVCWGSNANGELGAGLTAAAVPNTTIPVDVSGITNAQAITAGNGHVCALPVGSTVPKCWGRNDHGQLGNGSNTSANSPVNVSSIGNVTQISAGGELFGSEIGHTCARISDGTARCWGRNQHGQLGNDSASDSNITVTALTFDGPDLNNDPDILTGVVAVAAGGRHSCALMTDTTVRCWGRNINGQLGDGTTTDRHFAVIVDTDPEEPEPGDDHLDPFTGAIAITAGARHTCALKGDGTVWCWGLNTSGQLGDGGGGQSDIPVQVTGIPGGFTPGAASIAAGDFHTCARLTNGALRCWGSNAFGQLGNPEAGVQSSTPVPPNGFFFPPAGVDYAKSVSAGRRNTCATLIDTTVSCWGDNAHGQLGDGVGPTVRTPVSVLNLGSVGGNAIPDPQDDAASTAPLTPVVINVKANDNTDPDGDPLTISAVSDPPRGTASTDGSFVTYTPENDFCTVDLTSNVDTFTYSVTDGIATVPANVSVAVSCPNTPPVAQNDGATTDEDNPLTVNVLTNDSDPNGDSISVTSVTDPLNGTAVIDPGLASVTYTPDPDFCGADSFDYTISDGLGGSDTASVSMSVTCVNDPPVAVDDAAVTPEDTEIIINVVANDSDVDGPSIALSLVSDPPKGAATIVSPTQIKYVPDTNFCGADTFTYVISDGSATDSASVNVTVGCINDGPNAVDDSASTTEDTFVVINVLANDTDAEGDPLTVIGVTDPPNGTSAINPGGTSLTYTPDPDFCGADSFGYTVSDPSGEEDSALVVPVNVICVNDAPVANNDAVVTPEDTQISIDVRANDTDPDGDLIVVVSATDPANGTAQIGSSYFITYTPDPNFCGADSFDYTISDGNGESDTATVTMTISCVNDAPVLDSVPAKTIPWGEELNFALTASDPDGDPITYSLVSGPGGASVSAGGTFSWTPTSSQIGSFPVTVRATDPGALHDDETFQANVTKRTTTISYSGATSGQHTDPVVVSANLTDFDGNPITGRTLNFSIGSKSTTATTNASGFGGGSITLTDPAGSASVTTAFSGDSLYSGSIILVPFTIEKEFVSISFTGKHLTFASDTSGNVQLAAVIAEEQDGSLGSGLSTLQVSFKRLSGTLFCSSSVSSSGVGQGTGSCTTSSLTLGSRVVIVSVSGASYHGEVDVGVFTLAKSSSGSAAGAGRIETDPNDPLTRDDFGFAASPVKKAPPSGDSIHIFRNLADLGTGLRPYAFVVHSTTLDSLSRSCSGGKNKVCGATVIASDAATTVIDLSDGATTLIPGTSQIRSDATDFAEPIGSSVPPDTYAVLITGSTAYSLGTPSAQLTITMGNIRIPL